MITILGNPPTIAPCYNPMYFQVSSDKTAQEAFNFLFDVYVNGVFVNRDRLLPRPATTQAIYSPARMLESYVSYDLTQNVTPETASVNSIDKYKVIFGEEYIVYWNYTGLVKDTITLTSYTIVSSVPGNPHGYSLGDDILIAQDKPFSYAKYNGVHKVVAVLDENNILINVNWTDPGTILYEPGRTTWADKRKTEYIGPYTNSILNPTFQYLGGYGSGVGKNKWDATYSGSNQFKIETFNRMIFDMNAVGSGATMSVAYLGGTFTPGKTYKITFNVDAITNPSSSSQYMQLNLGGTLSSTSVGTGTFTHTMVCGGTGILSLVGYFNATTAAYHGFTMDSISVIEESYFSGYDFNAVLQYEEVPTWSYLDYVPTSSSSKFLTKQPNNVKCSLTDRGSIGVLNYLTYDPAVQYVGYITGTDYIGGTPRIPLPIPLTMVGNPTNTNEFIVTLPAYPWNINQVSQAMYSLDAIDSTSGTYGLTIFTANPADPSDIYAQVTETKIFEIDHDCTKYEPVRFMFLNSLGQFDYYSATLLSRTTLNTSRDTMVKTLSKGYVQGNRGKTVINVNSQESYSVNTNWISESTAQWLSYELFNSSEVYILDNTDGSITPVIIDNQSIEPKKRVNDSLINYQFNYSKAVPLNTQRN